jgi:hypothetical protein
MQRLSRSPRFSGKLSFVTPTPEDLKPATLPAEPKQPVAANAPREVGGREGPEPTRFGDWELRGRCIDF